MKVDELLNKACELIHELEESSKYFYEYDGGKEQKERIDKFFDNVKEYNEPKNIPDAGSIGAVRINLLDDEIDDIESGEIELEYPYSVSDNELWIWEQDKEKAEADFGY